MKTMLKGALFALAATSALTGASAQTTVFGDRATFLSALSSSFTDGYGVADGYSGGFEVLSNAAMTAVAGQTRYESTGFQNLNVLFDGRYCAGCNGSFTLHFDQTSLGNANGVGGVGLDIVRNDQSLPYSALVTFGNNDTQMFALPVVGFNSSSAAFFGLTSDRQILSIAFGPNGGTTQAGLFAIDNLTIGASGVVPEPASWAMLIAGFGLVGATARRREQQRRAVTA